jgi:hypothetical protein
VKIGGQWNDIVAVRAQNNEINYLELWAAFLALRALASNMHSVHVLMRLDNTTAVAYINHMGGTKSHDCNELAKEIWEWCQEHDIWVSAAYLPGSQNVVADEKSRKFDDQNEWQLDRQVFHQLCTKFGTPKIDMFASRLNCQVEKFVAWHPDPDAVAVDAFTLDWGQFDFYAFPPFCLLPRCLQKLTVDQAEGLFVVPCWTTQPWFPKLVQLLVEPPVILPKIPLLVTHPVSRDAHPLSAKMYLMCCRLSGRPSAAEAFQAGLPTFSCSHGDSRAIDNTAALLQNGRLFARNGKMIPCKHL